MAVCGFAYGLTPAQKKLMQRQTEELKQIHLQVMKQLVNVKKYKGKTLYVKVKVIEKPGKKFSYKVEKISADKPAGISKQKTGTVMLTGKVKPAKTPDRKFKLDLKYVLPPEK